MVRFNEHKSFFCRHLCAQRIVHNNYMLVVYFTFLKAFRKFSDKNAYNLDGKKMKWTKIFRLLRCIMWHSLKLKKKKWKIKHEKKVWLQWIDACRCIGQHMGCNLQQNIKSCACVEQFQTLQQQYDLEFMSFWNFDK